ncbi:MAG: ABC transporter permease [Bacteroidota bacterium]|nr:ABC transporter permease [Bacteroidota bacterium]
MFRNYIKIAWRNILRNRTTAFVNITGLALGITAFLFLLEYISLEKGTNQFHRNVSQIYRLINEDPANKTWPETEPGWASVLKQRYPQLKDACRYYEESGSTIISKKENPDQIFTERNTGYADGNFFTFFSFALNAGLANDLAQPNTVFLSASTAKKYFGTKDPLNQTLVVNNQFGKTVYTVRGVYADMEENSDLRFNLLLSYETLRNPSNLNGNDWAATDNLNSQSVQTWFSLDQNTQLASLEQELTATRTRLKPDKDGIRFHLQPLASMHLGRSLNDNYPTYANIRYVYLLTGVAMLILLIAWFNYINLSTANAFKRANEVGVKKVIGASRSNLVWQFLTEALVLNTIALGIALALVALLQPLFNSLIGKQLELTSIGASRFWAYGVLLFIAGSLLSGAYTAFSLSGYKPVEILKGKIIKTTKGILLRRSLVVSQFTISIALIIATVIIYSQVHFMQKKSLGLNAEQLLVLRGPQVGEDSVLKADKFAFKNELASQSFVRDFCNSGCVPSGNYNFATSGFSRPAAKKGDELKSYAFALIGAGYLRTYQIPLAAGRSFTEAETQVEWNSNNKILMNETAIRQIGFEHPEDAVNAMIRWDERMLQIIGVVKDYNHNGAREHIDPIIFYPSNGSSYYTIRLTPDNIDSKLASIEKMYKSNFRGNPFEYFFIDENFNKLYASERRYGEIFTTASVWAIFIACLGLFGLITFTVESRTKEIGVRKVLGAGIADIVMLLSRDFVWLVLIAFVIAVPVAGFAMQRWLENFAYRISIGWYVFVVAGMAALLLALGTISVQAIKAAMANPVKSLRRD